MAFSIVLIVLLVILLGVYYFFDYAVFRHGPRREKRAEERSAQNRQKHFGAYAPALNRGIDWYNSQDWEEVSITSRDGLNLVGELLICPGSDRTAVCMHGFRGSPYSELAPAYRLYRLLGFNVLTVWQRAHGKSEGSCIRYGTRERFDCLDWVNYVIDRFGENQKIILHGISMGATSVMCAAGLELPAQVRGVVADCGFTSAWDEMGHMGTRIFRFPAKPLVGFLNFFSKALLKFDFRECSTVDSLRRCRVPVLLIHGEDDNFVPTEMSRKIIDAGIPATLAVFPHATHCQSMYADPDRFERLMQEFVGRCMREDADGGM